MNVQAKNEDMRIGIVMALLFSSVLIPVIVNDAYAKCMVGDDECYGTPIVPPLKYQFQYFALPDIICPNQDHVLVERPNGKLACITDGMAEKTGWHIHYKNIVDAKGQVHIVSPGTVSWIPFEITGATLDKMIYENQMLVASVTSNDEDGVLSIQLSSGALPAHFEYCNPNKENPFDTPFVMILDDEEHPLDEGINSRGQAAVNIPLDENSETIKIIRTCNDSSKLSTISGLDEKNPIPISSDDDFDMPEVKLFLEKHPQAEVMVDHTEYEIHKKHYMYKDSQTGDSANLVLTKHVTTENMNSILSCHLDQNHNKTYGIMGSEKIIEYLQDHDCLSENNIGNLEPLTIRESFLELGFGDDAITVFITDIANHSAVSMNLFAASQEWDVVPINNLVGAHNRLPQTNSDDRRGPGTMVSDTVKAGTYIKQNSEKEFWYTIHRNEDQIITIELQNHEFDRITFVSENSEKWIKKINEITDSRK